MIGTNFQPCIAFTVVWEDNKKSAKECIFEVRPGVSTMVTLDEDENADKVFNMRRISLIERSKQNRLRILIAFRYGFPNAFCVVFDTPTDRDYFCALVRALSPDLHGNCKDVCAPKWISDKDAPSCMRCQVLFTVTTRRHHCRWCGHVVCGPCSAAKALLPTMCYARPERVCQRCVRRISQIRVNETLINIEHLQEPRISAGARVPGVRKAENDSTELARLQKWNKHIVRNVEISLTRDIKRMAKSGIPNELRGNLWQILCGSKIRQASTPPGFYQKMVLKAEMSSDRFLLEVAKDLHRTAPIHDSSGGGACCSTHELCVDTGALRRVLSAYSVFNQRVGYCQGMNFIAALLLRFMSEEDAFWMLAHVVEQLTRVGGDTFYFQRDLRGARIDTCVLIDLLNRRLPRVAAHMRTLGFSIQPITVNWLLCLFMNSVPLEATLRIWDIVFTSGVKIIFRAALAIIYMHSKRILSATCLEEFILELQRGLPECDADVFIKACYNKVLLGGVSMEKIEALRMYHKAHVDEELSTVKLEFLTPPLTPLLSPLGVISPMLRQLSNGSERSNETHHLARNGSINSNFPAHSCLHSHAHRRKKERALTHFTACLTPTVKKQSKFDCDQRKVRFSGIVDRISKVSVPKYNVKVTPPNVCQDSLLDTAFQFGLLRI
eukprot:125622_1